MEPTLFAEASLEHCSHESLELVPKMGFFDPLIYQMTAALKTSLETEPSGSRLYADTMGRALAVHLMARYSNRKPATKQYSGGLSKQKLEKVIAYIHEYMDRDLSLVELANLVQLSPYHFARLFKQSTGIAPHRYHIQCRIERAKQLLLKRNLAIADIACAVGFSSQAHLNYHFKRVVGVTPKLFLQSQ